MRNAFKQQAEKNTESFLKFHSKWIEGVWGLARKATDQIDKRLLINSIDKKSLDIIILLRNSTSDLMCCLDSLERGHDRTIDSVLRMVYEHFCLALLIFEKNEKYEAFTKDEISGNEAIDPAKKIIKCNDFGRLYYHYSVIVHHKQYSLLARQIVRISEDGKELYSHLKPINEDNPAIYLNRLLMIAFLLRFIAEHAEKVCAHIIKDFYFLKQDKGLLMKNHNTPEHLFFEDLVVHTEKILKQFKEN